MNDKPLFRLFEKVYRLIPDTKPLWGKMSAQHMVEHLILTLRIGTGKLETKVYSPDEKLPVLKRILLSNRPLPKNFISPIVGEKLLPLEFNDLDEAMENLKLELNTYYDFFEKNPDAILPNPTFGKLNKEEWELFHKKHFEHHLSQFGL